MKLESLGKTINLFYDFIKDNEEFINKLTPGVYFNQILMFDKDN